ncbi:uncharacterized protein [Henckelia pumila]|uniref:uncharacterized protein n=1 Tax=Henckelia pumila TaxID=405737 RepID=UPI003C6E7947
MDHNPKLDPTIIEGFPTPDPKPPDGGRRSYVDVFLSSSPRTMQKSFLDGEGSLLPSKPTISYKNKPGIFSSEEEIRVMEKDHSYSLIGKFSDGWPSKDRTLQAFAAVGFSGPYVVKFLRSGFLFIEFKLEEDMAIFWGKGRWFLQGFLLRVFKWSPKFDYQKEISIVSVWIRFPDLPISLFKKSHLYSVANLVCKPLKLDELTSKSERLTLARICVEKVVYESIPKYCTDCGHVGHGREECFVNGNAPRPPLKFQKPVDLCNVINAKREKADAVVGQKIGLGFKDVGERSPSSNHFDPLLADLEEEIMVEETNFEPHSPGGRVYEGGTGRNKILGNIGVEKQQETLAKSAGEFLIPNKPSSVERSPQELFVNAQSSVLCDTSLLELADIVGCFQVPLGNVVALGDEAALVKQQVQGEELVSEDSGDIEVESGVSKCITILESVQEETQANDRGKELWERLLDSKPVDGCPWIVGGDFNIIVDPLEHSMGVVNHPSGMHEFLDFIISSGLMDAGFVGSRFTWTNSRIWKRGLCRLAIKLKRLKHNLKWWNRDVFGNIHDKVKAVDLAAAHAEEIFDADPSEANREALSLAKANLSLCLSKEEAFWKQKASVKWLVEGEKNTTLFHNMVNHRRSRNKIFWIWDEGVSLENPSHIMESGVQFFNNLLIGEQTAPSRANFDHISVVIDEADNLSLVAPIFESEVFDCVCSLNEDGVAGSDGFSASFFKRCWDIIREDLMEAVRDF